LSDKVIPPGGEGKVEITVKTKGMIGNLHKSVSVLSNDPDEKSVRLEVKAEFITEFGMQPGAVNFGNHRQDEVSVFPVNISTLQESNLRMYDFQSSSPYLDIKEERKDVDGQQQIQLIVSLKEGLEIGKFKGEIKFKTNIKGKEEVILPINAEVIGDIQIPRSYVNFGTVDKLAPPSQSILVKNMSENKDYFIQKVVDDNKNLKIEIQTLKPGKEYNIVLTPNSFDLPAFNGELTIITDYAPKKDYTVRYSGRVLVK